MTTTLMQCLARIVAIRRSAPFIILLGALWLAPLSANAASEFPASFPGAWGTFGRVVLKSTGNSIVIANGTAYSDSALNDYEFSFRARAPQEAGQVQLWAAVRLKDRNYRYVVGLRGGPEKQLSLARYAPDGQAKFLGWVPLEFTPECGTWYALRIAVHGRRFHVYLNDEKLPRINIEDTDALWTTGGVGLGGGWLPAEFSDPEVVPLTGERLAAFKAIKDKVWTPPTVDKSKVRAEQRAAYVPATIQSLPQVRGEFSLNGQWLFMPDQDLGESAAPMSVDSPDQSWHVIAVPSFWTPTLGWLHGERDLPGLTGIAASKGPSDTLVAEEESRVDAQTFDWKGTNAGWYRHYLDLPGDLGGREFELDFDAIAKLSEIWVNGKKVATNQGMFRQIRCDITKYLRPGRNLLAVHDIGVPENALADSQKVMDVAVTMEVTNEMLTSIPHGMTDFRSGGIWQPVKLVVTNPVHVNDVFVKPELDGATADVQITNSGAVPQSISLSYAIVDASDSHPLFTASAGAQVDVAAGATTVVRITTPKVEPKLWTPASPNLYYLDLTLRSADSIVDDKKIRFGFRTFTVAGDKLLLNGQPYWLRGGDHFPATLRPNDAELARHFTQLAHDGNVRVTRSHAIPFTETWFDAADEIGMGVSYEGTWTWLMEKGPVPDARLLSLWKNEFAALLRQHRNHPSLLFWTVNNEMNFAGHETLGPDILTQKWTVLDDMIRTMRSTDPTRPIVAYSNYTRKDADRKSKSIREANHFDDGDIDDVHRYYGWYNPSFFHFYDGSFGREIHTPGRPLISQELSTGYPRNDDWPSRSYEFTRYVPQALVGSYAYEQNDPTIFMTRQAFMTKELAEVIRRTNRDEFNGVMHFAYLTWFTDVWKSGSLQPKMTYYALKTALQPVLVSVELRGRHFYAGDTVRRRVCLMNDSDDNQAIVAGRLTWELRIGEQSLAQGAMPTPPVAYYTNQWLDADFIIPATLPAPRVDAQLIVKLEVDGKTVSTNNYDIVLATKEWASLPTQTKGPDAAMLFDPEKNSSDTLAGIETQSISSLDELDPRRLLIVGDARALLKTAHGAAKFKAFVRDGGRALLLNPGGDLVKLFPDQVKSYRKVQGEIVTMAIPESGVFSELEPLDTAWFERGEGNLPYACTGTYEIDRSQPGAVVLASQCDLHAETKKNNFFADAGAPIVELQVGKGRVLATEMLCSSKNLDPIAGRLLRNMIAYLQSGELPPG